MRAYDRGYRNVAIELASCASCRFADPADLFPQALGREIGDMVAVIRRPPGVAPITKQLIIRGITHTVDISSNSWQTQWMLQDAARYAFFNLNDPTAGQLDNNPLAY